MLPQVQNLRVATFYDLPGIPGLLNLEVDLTYRDYKKFGADTKLVMGGEALEKH
jgi:hypothetical protein